MARGPKKFNDFIGQSRVISQLKKLIAGALSRGKPLPNLLLIGRAGWGKSSLAEAIAREYGGRRHTLSCTSSTKPREVEEILRSLEYGDIFHIEEGHLLREPESLYMALDEGRVPLNFLEARAAMANGGPLHMNVAPFTLVISTNTPGKIKPALRNRLHALELDRYSEIELKEIASQAALAVGLQLTGQAAGLLGKTALGNPRTARLRAERLWLTVSGDRADVNDVRDLLRSEGVDHLGLLPNQRVYLDTLAGARDHTMSLEMLVVKLGLDAPHIRQEIEVGLVDLGLIVIKQQHRAITREGLNVAYKIINIHKTSNNKDENEDDANNKSRQAAG